MMRKEEIGKLIDSKKFGKAIRCYGDDKLENIIKEIYFDGMQAGYDLAKFRLELIGDMPFGGADEYWNDNMKNIRSILELCKRYEESE